MCNSLSSQHDEQKNFIDTIKQLGNSSILIRPNDNARPEAVYISPEYISMMEDTQENASRFTENVYPEDMPLVQYLF